MPRPVSTLVNRHRTRRDTLLQALVDHEPTSDTEHVHWRRMLRFVAHEQDPFDRHLPDRHFTGSGLVASPDLDQVLLLHHRKLDLWLQCGGHADPTDASGLQAAIREAREETGLRHIAPHPAAEGRLLDVDIHLIPSRHDEPAHEHYDLRYLLVADPDATLRPAATEAKDLAWHTWPEAHARGLDPGLQRLLRKAQALRAARPTKT